MSVAQGERVASEDRLRAGEAAALASAKEEAELMVLALQAEAERKVTALQTALEAGVAEQDALEVQLRAEMEAAVRAAVRAVRTAELGLRRAAADLGLEEANARAAQLQSRVLEEAERKTAQMQGDMEHQYSAALSKVSGAYFLLEGEMRSGRGWVRWAPG